MTDPIGIGLGKGTLQYSNRLGPDIGIGTIKYVPTAIGMLVLIGT